MPSSAGISGKTAAPSGTSGSSKSSAMSAPCHRWDDVYLVAVLDGGVEVVQVADVLIVEVDVDEAPQLAVVEQPLRDARVLAAQVVEDALHGRATGLDRRLTL